MKKNKLLINTICMPLVLAGAIIPAVSCSCNKKPEPEPEPAGSIPVEDLLIENKALLGIKPGVDVSSYNTLCVPSDVVEVSQSAFDAKFGETVLPDSIKNIEFEDGEQILYIAGSAFAHCEHVENIKFSKRIAYVDEKAFSYCTSLKKLDFTGWDEKLLQASPFSEATVFEGCSESGELVLPETTNASADAYEMLGGTGLGSNWFTFQPQIQQDTLHNIKYYVEPDGSKVFAGLINWNAGTSPFQVPMEYTKIGPRACYMEMSGSYYGPIHSFTFEEGSQLEKICYGAFGNNTKLASIDLSNCTRLETIDVAAFQGQSTSALETVTLPTGEGTALKNLGAYAFYGNGGLKNADIQDTQIVRVGTGSFASCPNLVTLELPSTAEWIGALVISGNKKIDSITIPDKVSYIGARAFKDCTNVKSITFAADGSLQYIGQEAFNNCTLVTNINLPSSVSYIGDGVFNIANLETIAVSQENPSYVASEDKTLLMDKDHKNLLAVTKNVNLDCFKNWQELEGIRMYALANLQFTDLTELDLSGTSLSYIGDYAFYNLKSASESGFEVKLPNDPAFGMKYVGWRAFEKSDINNINANNWSNAKLYGYIFDNCSKLTEIEIPNGVTQIPQYSFQYCSEIRKITIPSTVQSIGRQAFYYCKNVNELYLQSFTAIPNWSETTAFDYFGSNVGNTIRCYVNGSLVNQWKQFFEEKMKVTNIGQWQFIPKN